MTKDAYPALFHFIHRQMQDISYPASLEGILKKAGEREVHTDWERTVKLRELLKTVKKQEFSCASDFYCALIASMN